MEIYGGIVVIALLGIQVYCALWFKAYFKERSDERTEARRAAYRAKAYKEMHERNRLRNSRETLWNTYCERK